MCAARLELDELRPEWTNAHLARIELEPLPAAASAGLVADLLGGAPLDAAVHARLADVAGGNPLFVRQLLSMLIEQGRVSRDNGSWRAVGDFSVTPGGRSARSNVVTRFARLVAEKTPGAAVATLCPKQEKPAGQK